MTEKNTRPRVLVIGAGSIGERHLRNLIQLGYDDLIVYRRRNLALRTLDASQVRILTDWDDVVAAVPHVAIICSPTAMHLEECLRCVEAGMHVLVEKPLSHTSEGLDRLEAALLAHPGTYLQVGYMMRYHPLLERVRGLIVDETYGRLVSFHSHWGEHLPYWHPWEDYRTSYAARTDLGGGAALTLSHDLDVALWLVDSPLDTHATLNNHASRLEVDVDSATDVLLKFENGTTGHVHLNFFQKNPERYYEYRFDEATIHIDYFADTVTTLRDREALVTERLNDFDRNDMFLAQTQDFFGWLDKSPETRTHRAIADIRRSAALLGLLKHPEASATT